MAQIQGYYYGNPLYVGEDYGKRIAEIDAQRAGTSSTTSSSTPIRREEEDAALAKLQAQLDEEEQIASMQRSQVLKNLESLTKAAGNAPKPPDLAGTFMDLRSQYGIDSIESRISAIDMQIQEASLRRMEGTRVLGDQAIPSTFIDQDMQRLNSIVNEDLMRLNAQRATEVDLLQTKTALVENIMNLTQMDYDNAVTAYNGAFDRAVSINSMFMDYMKFESAERSQRKQDALANISVLQNLMADSGKNWDDLDIDMQANFRALELKSGLPSGTMREFIKANPTANLLSTVQGTDSSGRDIVSFVYADENGMPGVVKTILTGGITRRTGGGPSEWERTLQMEQNINQELSNVSGDDGYVHPLDWRYLRQQWEGDKDDFDARFQGYVNPGHPWEYQGFEWADTNFRKKPGY